jgi:hypothetical protein
MTEPKNDGNFKAKLCVNIGHLERVEDGYDCHFLVRRLGRYRGGFVSALFIGPFSILGLLTYTNSN